jgi:protocatechuate 3,4-dioxygenase beta subunit
MKRAGKELLTTQCYIKGEPRNERDGIFRSLRDPKSRAALLVDFAPLKESRIGELAARFDIVLGVTPES